MRKWNRLICGLNIQNFTIINLLIWFSPLLWKSFKSLFLCAVSGLWAVDIRMPDYIGFHTTLESQTNGHKTPIGLFQVCISGHCYGFLNLEETLHNDWCFILVLCVLSVPSKDHVCADTGHTESKQPKVSARSHSSWIRNYEFCWPSGRVLLTLSQVYDLLNTRLLNEGLKNVFTIGNFEWHSKKSTGLNNFVDSGCVPMFHTWMECRHHCYELCLLNQ